MPLLQFVSMQSGLIHCRKPGPQGQVIDNWFCHRIIRIQVSGVGCQVSAKANPECWSERSREPNTRVSNVIHERLGPNGYRSVSDTWYLNTAGSCNYSDPSLGSTKAGPSLRAVGPMGRKLGSDIYFPAACCVRLEFIISPYSAACCGAVHFWVRWFGARPCIPPSANLLPHFPGFKTQIGWSDLKLWKIFHTYSLIVFPFIQPG